MAVTILVGCSIDKDTVFNGSEILDRAKPNNLDISDPSVDLNKTEDFLMFCMARRLAKRFPNHRFSLKYCKENELGMSKVYCGWILAMDFIFNYDKSSLSKFLHCKFVDPDGGNLEWEDI